MKKPIIASSHLKLLALAGRIPRRSLAPSLFLAHALMYILICEEPQMVLRVPGLTEFLFYRDFEAIASLSLSLSLDQMGSLPLGKIDSVICATRPCTISWD